MPVSKKKFESLRKQMLELGIREGDLLEKFITGSGSGGQKVNKTSSCVYLKHLPTGIEVKCQKERSRELNRYYARHQLMEKIASRILKKKTAKQKEQEKIRRQKQRRSRRSKEKMLEEKKLRSETKALRESIKQDND